MVTREKHYTVEEFFELADSPEYTDTRLELEDEVILVMPPSKPINTIIAGRIAQLLNNYVWAKKLGYVSIADGGYRMSGGNVRQPDIAFISKERLPEIPNRFDIAPDLAVEVVSENEDVLKKTKEYLESGTRLVWVVYPEEKTIEIFQNTEPRWQTLALDDLLTGGEVLPEFEIAVSEIFPS